MREREQNRPSAAVILQQPMAELIDLPLAEWGKRLPALASFAELVADGFRGARSGQSPWEISSFLELKTVWHPIGT